jgi:K+-transporting ATPase KdpF subunit
LRQTTAQSESQRHAHAAAFRPDCETCDARFNDAFLHSGFLRPGVPLRQGLSEIEVAMDIVTVVALIVSILLLGYLTFSLLYPEKF